MKTTADDTDGMTRERESYVNVKRIVFIIFIAASGLATAAQSAGAFTVKVRGLAQQIIHLDDNAQTTSGEPRHALHVSGCSVDPESALMKGIQVGAAEWNSLHGSKEFLAILHQDCEDYNPWVNSNQSRIIVVEEGVGISPDAGGNVTYNLNLSNPTNPVISSVVMRIPEDTLAMTSTRPCATQEYPWDLRIVLVHEFGHVLGLGHESRVRFSRMQPGPSRAGGLFCAETSSGVYPDDVIAMNFLYPSGDPAYDLAHLPYSIVPSAEQTDFGTSIPAARVFNAAPEFPPWRCPGETWEQEFSVANRGTEQMIYTRRFYLSEDLQLGGPDDIFLAQETNRLKSPGAGNGVFNSRITLTMPASGTSPGEQYNVMMEIVPETSAEQQCVSNDDGHFIGVIEHASGCD